ncbi:iron-containing alcohol dehydrogenase, partial [Candidatus Peregrinibacteria bacterium]|nr:iron-containing alcohol dehydrogenase [Candidatus Peregrinibacteria bacterium]
MTTITLRLKGHINSSYKIFIQEGVVNSIPSFLKKENIGSKYAIITDSTTKKLYGDSFLKFLRKNGIKTEIISFSGGELSKRLETVEKLAEEMVNKNFDRKDAIIILGGGIAGDMGGMLASIYMRGMPYIQIPTTLLAMVDSAIGGKTGVDLSGGKNLLGTTYQPKAVFIDLKYLKTLPDTQ